MRTLEPSTRLPPVISPTDMVAAGYTDGGSMVVTPWSAHGDSIRVTIQGGSDVKDPSLSTATNPIYLAPQGRYSSIILQVEACFIGVNGDEGAEVGDELRFGVGVVPGSALSGSFASAGLFVASNTELYQFQAAGAFGGTIGIVEGSGSSNALNLVAQGAVACVPSNAIDQGCAIARRWPATLINTPGSGARQSTEGSLVAAQFDVDDDLYVFAWASSAASMTDEITIDFRVRALAVEQVEYPNEAEIDSGAPGIVMVGDSYTAGTGTTGPALPAAWAIVALTRQSDRSRLETPPRGSAETTWAPSTYGWPAYPSVAHEGYGGATTLSQRDSGGNVPSTWAVRSAAISPSPAYFYFALGVNDATAAVSAEDYISRSQDLIDTTAADHPGVPILWQTPVNVLSAAETTLALYRADLGDLTGCTLVPIPTGWNTGTHLDDTVHPNAAGSLLMMQTVHDAIDAL